LGRATFWLRPTLVQITFGYQIFDPYPILVAFDCNSFSQRPGIGCCGDFWPFATFSPSMPDIFSHSIIVISDNFRLWTGVILFCFMKLTELNRALFFRCRSLFVFPADKSALSMQQRSGQLPQSIDLGSGEFSISTAFSLDVLSRLTAIHSDR
jgi:hypothetical protein